MTMVSIRASSAFFSFASLAPEPGSKSANGLGFVTKEAYKSGLKLRNDTKIGMNDYAENRFDEKNMVRFFWGTILPNGRVHRQYFPIRSYEIGPNGTVTLETLMGLLQESGINCLKSVGMEFDGLALTPEMCKRNIIWVMAKIQIKIDRYPSSGDVVEVDNSIATQGRTGMRRDSLIRDYKTGCTLLRASSYWLFMNQNTKKVTRIPNDLLEITAPYLTYSAPMVKDNDEESLKVDETTDNFICGGLRPRRSDLDGNQHVNNAKYIGWIFESVPLWILENYELCRITMEYRRECHLDSVVQSKTTTSTVPCCGPAQIECSHLLTLESGPQIMKARTSWRPKSAQILGNSI